MDVTCATCQEPWDHHHMLHDEPYEIWDGIEDSSSGLLLKKWKASSKTKIPAMMREDLEERGWKFGRCIVTILRCPCCDQYDELDDEETIATRKQLRIEAEQLLGDDLDGLISTLGTVDLFAEVG